MNSLSWLIYAAELIPSLAALLSWVGFFSIIGFALYVIVGCIINEDCYNSDSEAVKERKRDWWSEAKYLPSFKQVMFVSCVFLVSVLLPSKETIYLVAGSEAGEAVVASEEGREILSDIQEIIDIQMNKLKQ